MRFICAGAALAALTIAAAPASAATLIGNQITITRFNGPGSLFGSVSATVGAGAEYEDNFFTIDVSANQIVFDVVSRFSIGGVFYDISGLDFDGVPATPNVIEDFAWSEIVSTSAADPFGPGRLSVAPDGMLRVRFANTNAASGGFATLTLGPPPVAAVPEPATWAMMIGGFGLVGGALRRAGRRRLRLAYDR